MKSLRNKIITKLIRLIDSFINEKSIPGTKIYGPISILRLGKNVTLYIEDKCSFQKE
jgi:hypothetical protein